MRVKRRVSYDMLPIQLVDSCNMGSKLSQSHSDLKPVSNDSPITNIAFVNNQSKWSYKYSICYMENV